MDKDPKKLEEIRTRFETEYGPIELRICYFLWYAVLKSRGKIELFHHYSEQLDLDILEFAIILQHEKKSPFENSKLLQKIENRKLMHYLGELFPDKITTIEQLQKRKKSARGKLSPEEMQIYAEDLFDWSE